MPIILDQIGEIGNCISLIATHTVKEVKKKN